MSDLRDRSITITLKVARELAEVGHRLWHAGTGIHALADPERVDNLLEDGHGLIDDINPAANPELHDLANALLSFARMVAGIMQNAVDGFDEEIENIEL